MTSATQPQHMPHMPRRSPYAGRRDFARDNDSSSAGSIGGIPGPCVHHRTDQNHHAHQHHFCHLLVLVALVGRRRELLVERRSLDVSAGGTTLSELVLQRYASSQHPTSTHRRPTDDGTSLSLSLPTMEETPSAYWDLLPVPPGPTHFAHTK